MAATTYRERRLLYMELRLAPTLTDSGLIVNRWKFRADLGQ